MPVAPRSSSIRYRLLVSAAVAKPASWRIVHGLVRYIPGWIPRVNGYSPGRPTRSSRPGATSPGPAAAGSGIPAAVVRSSPPMAEFLPDHRPAAQSEPATASADRSPATAAPSITERRVGGPRGGGRARPPPGGGRGPLGGGRGGGRGGGPPRR